MNISVKLIRVCNGQLLRFYEYKPLYSLNFNTDYYNTDFGFDRNYCTETQDP